MSARLCVLLRTRACVRTFDRNTYTPVDYSLSSPPVWWFARPLVKVGHPRFQGSPAMKSLDRDQFAFATTTTLDLLLQIPWISHYRYPGCDHCPWLAIINNLISPPSLPWIDHCLLPWICNYHYPGFSISTTFDLPSPKLWILHYRCLGYTVLPLP